MKSRDWLKQTDIYSQHANALSTLLGEGNSHAPERAAKAADCTKVWATKGGTALQGVCAPGR